MNLHYMTITARFSDSIEGRKGGPSFLMSMFVYTESMPQFLLVQLRVQVGLLEKRS